MELVAAVEGEAERRGRGGDRFGEGLFELMERTEIGDLDSEGLFGFDGS